MFVVAVVDGDDDDDDDDGDAVVDGADGIVVDGDGGSVVDGGDGVVDGDVDVGDVDVGDDDGITCSTGLCGFKVPSGLQCLSL